MADKLLELNDAADATRAALDKLRACEDAEDKARRDTIDARIELIHAQDRFYTARMEYTP